MTTRQALILVVPEVRQQPKLKLPVVAADAANLHNSLQKSGYTVGFLGAKEPRDITRNSIGSEIRKACREVPAGGTLLLFMSGHGVHIRGRDYLVPHDADLNDPEDSFFPIGKVNEYADDSKASVIVLFVDACREGADLLRQKGFDMLAWGAEKRFHAKKRLFWIVFSCHSGEYAHYVDGDGGFSLFSSALATVLAPTHPARTLNEVLRGAGEELAKLLERHHPDKKQGIYPHRESELGDASDPVICDGYVDAGPVSSSAWHHVVGTSPLWRHLGDEPERRARVEVLKDAAVATVKAAREAYDRARAVLDDDPWADVDYPVRVVRMIEELTGDGHGAQLTASEVALLLAAPFVREHVYATAIHGLAAAMPCEIDTPDGLTGTAADVRRQLETTFRAQPQFIRRATKLRESTDKRMQQAGRAILHWVLHRHMSRNAGMWRDKDVAALGPTFRKNGAKDDLTAHQREAMLVLETGRLRKLAKCVRSETDRLTRRDSEERLEVVAREMAAGDDIRERLLGCLLCLAGWMALDVRAASDVVADHVGLADALDPKTLVEAVRAADWSPVPTGFQLRVQCGHPAIDLALRELAGEANRNLVRVTQIIADDPQQAALVDMLPGQLTADGISAVLVPPDDRPAYTVPHRQFTLAHREITELLMGQELYGNPDLAIRELYQNALDACRYRQARTDFLRQQGKPQSWDGKIVFQQGVADKRAYVECRDNGIGMGVYEIEACFSKAGRRFSDLPEFIEEQSQWLLAKPPVKMTPNGQFGIGVLSYFMIAEEIEIETCRLDLNGVPGQRLLVQIPGSGGLFKVQEAGAGTESGTRVRLYLRDDWKHSCVEVLERLLFLAEFETDASDAKSHTAWPANQPRDADRFAKTVDPDFWWDREFEGRVLVDGIAVDLPEDRFDKSWRDKAPSMGALINLRNERRPRLTVDRKMIITLDEDWIVESYTRCAASLVVQPWLRFSWAWRLTPKIREAVEKVLVENDGSHPIGYRDEIKSRTSEGSDEPLLRELSLPVGAIGIDSDDGDIIVALIDANGDVTADAKVSTLRKVTDYSSYNLLQYDGPSAGREAWAAALMRDLTPETWDRDKKMRRVAVLGALGFPMPDWLKAILPVVDVGGARAAVTGRVLPKPPEPKEDVVVVPPSRWARLGNRLEAAFNAMPVPVQMVLVFSGVIVAGHFIFEGVAWGLSLAWRAVF